MTGPAITAAGDGRFIVSGELTFATVAALQRESVRVFAGNEELLVDLDDVAAADSAGLALLVDWTAAARQQGRHICFTNMPAQLLAIARVSGLDEVLPLRRE